MIIEPVLLVVLVSLALFDDIKNYRISNALVAVFALFGVVLGFFHGTLASSLLGMVIPLLLMPLFVLRMLGAGDIKLLCAAGAISGRVLSVKIVIYSFIFSGIIALGLLIVRKNGRERLIYLINYFKQCFILGKLLPYADFKKKDSGKFRFGFGVFFAALLVAVNMVI